MLKTIFQLRPMTIFWDEDDGTGGGGASNDSGAGDINAGDQGVKPAQKFIEKKDPKTGKMVKIPAELDAVLGHFISTTREAIEGKYAPMLKTLEDEKADLSNIKVEYEKLKEASMSAEERAQANAQKVIAEHEKKVKVTIEELTKWKNLFFSTTVQNDILASFGDVKLHNPKQVAILFEKEGDAHPEETVDSNGKLTGRFETRMKLMLENDHREPEPAEGTPYELFKKWINLERNLHHMQIDINSGGGTRIGVQLSGKKQADLSKLPPKERIDAARQASKQ